MGRHLGLKSEMFKISIPYLLLQQFYYIVNILILFWQPEVRKRSFRADPVTQIPCNPAALIPGYLFTQKFFPRKPGFRVAGEKGCCIVNHTPRMRQKKNRGSATALAIGG